MREINEDRVIREDECRKLTGVCRTTRYELEKKGRFPSRLNLGGRSVGWLLSEVMEWVKSRDRINSGKAA
ncbi:helix-turn-helix transcriptional regulator [Escherichia coli]|uniref:Prophage CP4-57 regulatory family protein n=1 Tax=Escherichia coli 3.4880 TaxID=1051347 RepID=A0AAV3I418_ECOLX|nr:MULTISPECIES: AlpA family phage regulatory protein [Enterobacteriaceae]EFA4230287.1 AlpA family phage regulatory protein [Escherichia coli O40:H32]EFA4304902.1 AlpA family phage regulatory protein [Escherichia coli O19]EFE0989893.1 AlpA family phage regulatory protein [Escherichia coli O159:H19]EFE2150305.1 AlpA family phage regulatory protein [Escherichia coli O8:H28]EFY9943798.1 AlpA family phage regulatory protein [Shigella boydii]EHD3375879.1 AlpA family phage regulatory protein [Esche